LAYPPRRGILVGCGWARQLGAAVRRVAVRGFADSALAAILVVAMCPHCGRDAPIVYRGPLPYCTACGRPRTPLSSPSVNLAGKPSKVGGALASVAGALVLVVGLSLALGLGLLLYALITAAVALAVAIPIAIAVLVIGIALVRSGRLLTRSGSDAQRATRERALLELAAHRGGVTAADAARALDMGISEADAMLTAMAKREPERLTIDVDDQGVVWYRPARVTGPAFDARVRVDPSEAIGEEGEPGDAAEETGRSELRR
jgi:hypothetical protein